MKSVVVICLLFNILMIFGCGRMSAPVAPEGSVYPQKYVVMP